MVVHLDKVIIAGSRCITNPLVLAKAIDTSNFEIGSLVCGMARGVDLMGHKWAHDNNLEIHEYPANWKRYGENAGFIRNKMMAKNADGLIAIWDGKSKGTLNMIYQAEKEGLIIYIYNILDLYEED